MIADDHSLFRKGMGSLILEFEGIEFIGEAANGRDLLEKMNISQPDVVLLDLKMPVMDGIAANDEIQKMFPDVKVIILSMYNEDKFIIHLIESGANGYLLKNAEPDEVEDAIHAVIRNGYYFNDHVSQVMLKGLITRKKIKPSFNTGIEFTPRELEVLKLICGEFTNAEIGRQLHLSTRTIDGYRTKLLHKIGAKNTAGIVMFAAKNGLVE